MKTMDMLRQFIQDELFNGQNSGGLEPDEDLLLSGRVDSLGVVRLIAFIEEELKIHVPAEDVTIDHFLTLQAMVDYLETRDGLERKNPLQQKA